MSWKPPVRNRTNIQAAAIRADIDPIYEAAHDALSAHFYNNRNLPLEQRPDFIWNGVNYGKLSTSKFHQLHGLIMAKHTKAIFDANSTAAPGTQDSGLTAEATVNSVGPVVLLNEDGTTTIIYPDGSIPYYAESYITDCHTQGTDITV